MCRPIARNNPRTGERHGCHVLFRRPSAAWGSRVRGLSLQSTFLLAVFFAHWPATAWHQPPRRRYYNAGMRICNDRRDAPRYGGLPSADVRPLPHPKLFLGAWVFMLALHLVGSGGLTARYPG